MLKSAFVVTLGGAPDNQKQWGSCLAVKTDSSLAQLRSSIGNALAQASSSQGLRAIGVVAYVEVISACSRHVPVTLYVANLMQSAYDIVQHTRDRSKRLLCDS